MTVFIAVIGVGPDSLCGYRVRQVLGEALTAEDDAAVLQELEELEGKEAQAEASELPAAPKVPQMPTLWACMASPLAALL